MGRRRRRSTGAPAWRLPSQSPSPPSSSPPLRHTASTPTRTATTTRPAKIRIMSLNRPRRISLLYPHQRLPVGIRNETNGRSRASERSCRSSLSRAKVARSAGFEPTTSASAGLRSIQLSYKRVFKTRTRRALRGARSSSASQKVVPKEGLEPTRPLRTLRPERSASTIPPLRPEDSRLGQEFTTAAQN